MMHSVDVVLQFLTDAARLAQEEVQRLFNEVIGESPEQVSQRRAAACCHESMVCGMLLTYYLMMFVCHATPEL